MKKKTIIPKRDRHGRYSCKSGRLVNGAPCSHVWYPRKDTIPVKCPGCQSYRWMGK